MSDPVDHRADWRRLSARGGDQDRKTGHPRHVFAGWPSVVFLKQRLGSRNAAAAFGIRPIECDIRMPVGHRPWQLPGEQ